MEGTTDHTALKDFIKSLDGLSTLETYDWERNHPVVQKRRCALGGAAAAKAYERAIGAGLSPEAAAAAAKAAGQAAANGASPEGVAAAGAAAGSRSWLAAANPMVRGLLPGCKGFASSCKGTKKRGKNMTRRRRWRKS